MSVCWNCRRRSKIMKYLFIFQNDWHCNTRSTVAPSGRSRRSDTYLGPSRKRSGIFLFRAYFISPNGMSTALDV